MEIFSKIIICFQRYTGTGTQFLLFLCALLFLAGIKESRNIHRVFITYTSFIIFIMVFPVTAIIIMDYCIGEEVYWRMFWLIPIPFIMAIAAVKLIMHTKVRRKQAGIAAFLILLVAFCGKYVYSADTITKASNLEKLPAEVEEVCNIISEDALKNQLSQKKAVVPADLLSYIRQYDATIEMPYGRNALKDEGLSENCDKIYNMVDEEAFDSFLLAGYLKAEACNYLVLNKNNATSELDAYGYYQIAQTADYIVYRCDDMTAHAWRITQHPDDENSMFYTIESDTEGLIVVDGGWAKDADSVREVIASYGNKVDAWMITHPHKDHAGAFCAIYPDLQGIEVGQVYAVDMASEELCAENAPWDTFETLEAFQALDIPQLQYVHKGDQLSINGLTVDILSAYDDYVDELSDDLLNDGSMMFQIKGNEQSMLFCADVGISMSDYLESTYGEALKADYIQMGHHGNGGLSESFYRLVNPEVAFFDAPQSLMYPAAGTTYTTPANRELMKSLGAKVYYFATGDNNVILK